jgi:hypothetical protein
MDLEQRLQEVIDGDSDCALEGDSPEDIIDFYDDTQWIETIIENVESGKTVLIEGIVYDGSNESKIAACLATEMGGGTHEFED